MRKVKALWHLSEDQSSIQETDIKEIEDLVSVNTAYSMISLGTERLVAMGQVPHQLYQQMNVPYMEGSFVFPIKYGYSLTGQLEDGRGVHLMHPHQNYCLVQSQDITTLPETIPLKRATLIANLETALNAVWDGNVQLGDHVLVVGFGLVGSLVARLIDRMPATKVVVADTNPKKVELASSLGFKAVHPAEISDTFDLAYNVSASGAGLQAAIDAVGFEGKIIELSWYGNRNTVLELGGAFHNERKQLISSQVSNLPPFKRGRWDYKRRKEVVIDLLVDPIFDSHITQEIPLEELPDFFNELRYGTSQALGVVVTYS